MLSTDGRGMRVELWIIYFIIYKDWDKYKIKEKGAGIITCSF